MSAGLWGWSSGALSLLHLGMLVFIFIHNILTKGKVDMRQVELVLGKLQLRDDQRKNKTHSGNKITAIQVVDFKIILL